MQKEHDDASLDLFFIQDPELELIEPARGIEKNLPRRDIQPPLVGVEIASTAPATQSGMQTSEALMYVLLEDQIFMIEAQVDTMHVDQVCPG